MVTFIMLITSVAVQDIDRQQWEQDRQVWLAERERIEAERKAERIWKREQRRASKYERIAALSRNHRIRKQQLNETMNKSNRARAANAAAYRSQFVPRTYTAGYRRVRSCCGCVKVRIR